jgi:ATP-binding cassette subfamily C protein
LFVYVVLTILLATLTRARSIAEAKVVQEYALSLRSRLYTAVARAEWLVLSRIRTSDFTYALTTAMAEAERGANNALYVLATSFVALVYALLAFRVSPSLSAMVLGATILILLTRRIRTGLVRGRSAGAGVVASTQEMYATAAEQLGGLKTAKSYGQEMRHLSLFLDAGRKLNRAQLGLTHAVANLRWQMTVGSVIALSVILYIAVSRLHLPTAAILLLLFLFSRLVPRLLSIQQTYQEVLSVLPALETIEGLIAQCERSPEKTGEGHLPVNLEREIRLDGLSFSYADQDDRMHLASITMSIPARKTSAIVGASGAGKSTVADILLGLIRPLEGKVLVDDVPLDDGHIASWRSQIGYVAQDTFLFNDTVRFNLDWAKPGASESEMLHALEQAAATGFLAKLPLKLDTVIGERGVQLSGGERQRLSLARALLRKPRLLVLDEATSALDSENEERIYSAIRDLPGEITVVIITHRLATVRSADLIHLLDEGKLSATGTWNELLATSTRFQELARAQGIV